MRRFSSYGPINPKLHYYASREGLIDKAYTSLIGESPDEGGHYITVWAPRQTGKTWVMQEVVEKIKKTGEYDIGIISLESAKKEKKEKEILSILVHKLSEVFQKQFPSIKKIRDISYIFTKQYFQKPVILIIDEFDSLEEVFINSFAAVYRDIFVSRTNERDKRSKDKTRLLHGLALVGVRSVLGIENETGSPFNIQRSLHIPDLTYDEVKGMWEWYEKESGQTVEEEVIGRLFYETRGQPGLTCWLGELLTEGFEDYTPPEKRPINMEDFDKIYAAAIFDLPNNNILNIISKAKQKPYKQMVLELFRTDRKQDFSFDNEDINFLYMHGVVDREIANGNRRYARFASPLVQKRLFNYFSGSISRHIGRLYDPLLDLETIISRDIINVKNLVELYRQYLKKNRQWLFKNAPRRSDMKIREAVFHFNLYSYLNEFLKDFDGNVLPEFPTGNGKVDLLIRFRDRLYALEVKSFSNLHLYREALAQAAGYAKQLGISEISLVFFIDSIDDRSREQYQAPFRDDTTGVKVMPLFIETTG